VRAATGDVEFRAPYGVAAPDSSTVVQAQPISTGTRVAASDAGGIARWSHDVAGTRTVRVVSPGGKFVALVDGNLNTPNDARSATTVTVVTATGARELRVRGNVDPEAFSTDGKYLYVLDFLPAMNPTHYSVSRVDLQTQRVESVPDRNGKVGDPMPGYAQRQLMSADGSQLYTFYASAEPVTENYEKPYFAWVHVLNLDEGWAYCVGLDETIGVRGEADPALAESPDGSRLFLTDGVTNALASIDTKSLKVLRTRFSAPPLTGLQASAFLATDGDTLFTRDGYAGLSTIDAGTLERSKQVITAPATISTVRVDHSSEALYVLTDQGMFVLDRRGRVLRTWANPGDATSIDPSVTVPGSGAYRCAC
jgi:hypothetical protein